jgi:hypothetical protein
MPSLFESIGFTVRELLLDELSTLQALFEANPEYFVTVNGKAPDTGEAIREFNEMPPAHLTFGTRWFAGVFDKAQRLCGAIILVHDLSAKGVWHIALFFMEARLRGTGAAQEVYASLEEVSYSSHAQWLRLAVIDGNLRAERFWIRQGYSEVRKRQLQNPSGEIKTSKVMVKPLRGGTLAEYLHLVPRDAPSSPLQ